MDERRERRLTRRRFLDVVAKTSLFTGLGGWSNWAAKAATNSEATIAIIGGGLAGLTCA